MAMSAGNSLDPGELVEADVKAGDSVNAITFHQSGVQRVPGRKLLPFQHDSLRTSHRSPIHSPHIIDDIEDHVERGLDGIPASVTNAMPSARQRSSSFWASGLWGCAAPTRYMGTFESTKINRDSRLRDSPARSR